jgi:thymidylate kinase
MFVLLNGSFGIGKTTTANRLVQVLPGAGISDPEHVGYVLRRLPAWILGLRRQPDDYQDLPLWRRLIVHQARLAHRRARIVIVPMAFTNLTYLDDFSRALSHTAPVTRICLVAPLELVRQRLLARAKSERRMALTEFEIERSTECVQAHAHPEFGAKIDATANLEAVVAQIRAVIHL